MNSRRRFNLLDRVTNTSLQTRVIFGVSIIPLALLAGYFAFAGLPVIPATPEERTRALDELRTQVAQAGDAPSDSQLTYFEKKYPKSEAASLARFRRGYDRVTAKDYPGAIDLLDEALIGENSGLGPYALYYKGKAYLETGQYQRAESTLTLAGKAATGFPFQRDAFLLAGRAAAARQDLDAANRALAPLIEKNDGDALGIIAALQEQLGQTDGARATYLRIYFQSSGGPDASTVESKLLALGVTDLKAQPADQWLARAEALYGNRQYQSACDAYGVVLTLDPEGLKKDTHRFHYGVSLFFTKKYPQALSWLTRIGLRDRDLTREAMYYQVEAERAQGLPGFVATGEKFLAQYPQDARAGNVLANIAEYQERRGNGAATYARLIREYPDNKAGDKYSYTRAWKVHQSGSAEAGGQALLEHVASFVNSDYKGLSVYWAARDFERAGNVSRALALYEALLKRYRYGYYGQMALRRITEIKAANSGVKPETADAKSLLGRAIAGIQPAKPLPETVGKEADPALTRATDLRIIGLMDLSLDELEVARQTAPTSRKINLEIARVFRDRGEPLRAVQTLQRAHPDYLSYQGPEITREEWEIFFPLKEWDTIKREAKANGLDPFIVAGLIRQESVFNPKARSRVNALGLMQLMPATGKLVARKSGSGLMTPEQLFNPKLNIQLGTIYLSDMVRQFGRYEYAFAAYNGGPGRVSTWLRTLPTSEIDLWVEAIPISETRLYVQGVLRNAAHYRRLYGDGETPSTKGGE